MNFISRLILILALFAGFSIPVTAAVVAADSDGYCGVVAADDKKTDGEKEPEGEEEPDCE
jgi:hypothetical protein